MTRTDIERLITPIFRDSLKMPIAWREHHRTMALLCQVESSQIRLAAQRMPVPQAIVMDDEGFVLEIYVNEDAFWLYCLFFRPPAEEIEA